MVFAGARPPPRELEVVWKAVLGGLGLRQGGDWREIGAREGDASGLEREY